MDSLRPQVEVHYEEPAPAGSEESLHPWYKRPMARRFLIAAAVVVVALLVYFNWGRLTNAGNRLSSTNNAILVPSDSNDPNAADQNDKILMDRAEVDRLRAQAEANARPSTIPSTRPQPYQPQTAQPQSSMTPPPTDSQGALAPNGTPFAGTGRYQFYRQGNLTWRLDTDTGAACVIFATNQEWRKPQVYRHGCRR